MQKISRRHIFGKLLEHKQEAIIGLVLSLTVGTWLTSSSLLAQKADLPRERIKTVHWIITRTTYPSGGNAFSVTCDNQMKFPDKWRIDQPNLLIIWNGLQFRQYNKKMNTYWRRKNNQSCQVDYSMFMPEQEQIKCTSRGGEVSKHNVKAVFKGLEYDSVELSVPARKDQSGETVQGLVKETIYIDPTYGLMRAYCVQKWDMKGDKVVEEEQSEYEYTEKDNLPDSLFDIQAQLPADATEEP